MAENKPSLILITVDCLRADHCGFYGYSRGTTPRLDVLAAESVVVPTAVVAGAPTYYSLPAIFASRMPLALGRDIVGLAPGEDTLTKVLKGAGYATAAFTAANPYISPQFGFDRGFDEFRDFLNFDSEDGRESKVGHEPAAGNRNGPHSVNRWLRKSAQASGLGKVYDELYFQYLIRLAAPRVSSMDALRKYPSADVVIEAAKAWIDAAERERPFFLWLHLMDPHAPYYPPAAAFQELTGTDISATRARYVNEFWNRADLAAEGLQRKKAEVVELYDASIRWVDSEVGRFVEYLRNTRGDDWVLALTADHGEEFLEHGRRFHVPVSLADEIVRVPLLIRVPGRVGERENRKSGAMERGAMERGAMERGAMERGAMKSGAPFSLLDLAPTLLEVVGVPSAAGFRGKSGWSRLTEEPQASAECDPALTECAYGCTNPYKKEMRLAARLLSVRDRRYKLVIQFEKDASRPAEIGKAVEQLYDLESDPGERKPVASGDAPEIRKRFLKIAAEHIGQTIEERPVAIRMEARLRELGLELKAVDTP